MRFYLDNDVDARCGTVLRRLDHECWTTSEAGRSDAGDDDQTAYAQSRGAVLLTHDREFTQRRRLLPIGLHVRLDCEQPDGPDLVRTRLDVVIDLLAHHRDLTIELGWSRCHSWWGTEQAR